MRFVLLIGLLQNYLFSALAVDEAPTISWNVSAVALTTKKGRHVTVLDNVKGFARKGKLHAIMGPSGSGKSTLLNVLANAVPKKSLELSGEMLAVPGSQLVYVQQEDILFSQLTVEETLDTSATLRLKDATKKDLIVEKLINNLNLKKAKGTKVGDAKTRGISGGEKKRLCIGNECIGTLAMNDNGQAGNTIIFADEPTSGLDSYQAQRAVELLKDLATDGECTVIASVHQPRASIVALFDDITLIAEGICIYTGSAKEMPHWFKSIGFPCPSGVNPAEYYLDLISIDNSSPEEERKCRERVTRLAEMFTRKRTGWKECHGQLARLVATQPGHRQQSRSSSSVVKATSTTAVGRIAHLLSTGMRKTARSFSVLFRRAWRQVSRDKALNIARFMSSFFSALLFGAIYYQLPYSAATVPDRLGLLQVAAVNTAMTALIKATTSFVTEKIIVQRERRTGAYSVAPYFVSKLAAEAPIAAFFPCMAGFIMYKLCGLNDAPGRLARFMLILTVESFASTALGMAVGSLAPSVEAAIAIAPSVMVIFIVFGGLYVVNTPSYLQWVPSVSLIRWAYEALCINEFSGLKLQPDAKFGPRSYSTGEQVLQGMGIKSSLTGALLAQTSIIVANWLFTYLSLLRQKPDFERIQSSSIKSPGDDNEGGSTGGVARTSTHPTTTATVVSESSSATASPGRSSSSSSSKQPSREKTGSGSGSGGMINSSGTSRHVDGKTKIPLKAATTALPLAHRGGWLFSGFSVGSGGMGSGMGFGQGPGKLF